MESISYLTDLQYLTPDGHPQFHPAERFSLVKSGVIFQRYCRNGLKYDVAISWLQKAVRRGLLMEALYCAHHITDLGRIFASHLLNRLAVMISEDIGASQPGLPRAFAPVYSELVRNRSDPEWRPKLVSLIATMCRAQKSRLACLTCSIHRTSPEIDVSEEAQDSRLERFRAALKDRDYEECSRHLIAAHLGGGELKRGHRLRSPRLKSKRKEIYLYWDELLKGGHPDVKALLVLFEAPIEEKLLFAVHALVIAVYDPGERLAEEHDAPTELPEWDEISGSSFPVMNDAIDMHTFDGRWHLGRDKAFFLERGSRVEPHRPIGPELEYHATLLAKARLESGRFESTQARPRPYQSELIDAAADYLARRRTGWLVMACGTGKTRTSYWITYRDPRPRNVLVVTPYLGVLAQFYRVWSALHTESGRSNLSGIFASSFDHPPKSDCSYYNTLSKKRDREWFFAMLTENANRPEAEKRDLTLFTTYAGLKHLPESFLLERTFDLAVYDEAHHLKAADMPDASRQLLLTATPPKDFRDFGGVIGEYGLGQAISDGHLTDYEVTVERLDPSTRSLVEFLDRLGAGCRRVIVFSKTNQRSQELCELAEQTRAWKGNCFYLDHKMTGRKRTELFRSFQECKRAIVFNCAVLAEGIDFPDCDGVYFESGYTSYTRVIQGVGRCLRLSTGKRAARVYMTYTNEDDYRYVDKRLKILADKHDLLLTGEK
jgi:superfamily II DNA or RNA helicase